MFRNILIVCLVLLNFVYAQSDDDLTQQLWFDFNPLSHLDENYTLYGALGARTNNPYSWTKIYLTTAVRFAPDPLFDILNKSQQEIHCGLSLFYTINDSKANQIELRPYQGYRVAWPHFKRIKFTHFFRLEERCFFTVGESDFNFTLRLRYKLEGTIHWSKHLVDFADGFYFPISVEFFINLYSTQQYNNAARPTVGIGYSSDTDGWKVQWDTSYQYTANNEGTDYTKSTIIYRFRFFYSI